MDENSVENENQADKNNNKKNSKTVNLSNNALTVVPVTLFKRIEITHLDVSENNIKSLPIDITNLVNLEHLNICRNGFHCTTQDDVTILPKSMKDMKFLKYLNISECNLVFIPATIWEITSLHQLDISKNNIHELKPDIGNLDQLRWLNAQHCGLTTLPQEIVGCEKLETLLLYGNVIQTIPYLLADIMNLKILTVNFRHLGEKIDSNMESLLQSGQILSDHISNTIFNLPAVKAVELEFCKINYFKHFKSKALLELYIRGNFFREIPETILNMNNLEILDLSKNLLINVNNDIIKLENLTNLYLQENQIEKITLNLFQMKSLKILDLSYNKIKKLEIPLDYCNNSLITLKIDHNNIKKLPNNIINLERLENFDACNNKISEIPLDLCLMRSIKTAHSFNGLYKVGLWILNNPIEFPPKYVWNTTNIDIIYSFLQKTKIERLQRKTPTRVILIGENLQKQIFLEKFLGKRIVGKSEYLTVNQWTSANSVPFVLVNINCHPIFSMHLRYYIEDNSLIWLFIDNEQTNNQLEQIEKWINIVIDYSTDCVIQIIFFNYHENNLEEDNLQNVNEAFETQLITSLQEKFQNENIKILPNILVLSNGESLNSFKDELEYIAINKNLFQDDSIFNILTAEKNSIESICKSTPCIYITLNDLISKIKEIMPIDRDLILTCLKALHKQGKILWFYNNKRLSDKIYPFISLFNKSIQSLIRLDYDEDLDFVRNPLIKAEGLMNEDKFEKVKTNFFDYGEICYPLYKVLTFELKKSKSIKDFLVDASVAWVAPISVYFEEDIFQRPYVVLSQFNTENFDKDYFLNSILKKETVNIDCSLSIRSLSLGDHSNLFFNLKCDVNCWAVRRYDWLNVIYLYHNDGDILIFNETSTELQMNIAVIVRSWSKLDYDQLPCDGDFKKWIIDWYNYESESRKNFSYNVVDLNLSDIREYLLKF